MKISIVTISFNQVAFLEKAIQSVLGQEYADIEYIVIDPGSTDGSRDIIERYRRKISHVVLEPDDGPADGLNKGFGLATGDIFGCINADDEYLPHALHRVADEFGRDRDAGVLCGHAYIADTEGKILRHIRSDPFNLKRFVHGGVTAMQQATFYRKKAFMAVNGFNKANRTCWDGELLADIALKGFEIKIIDKYLGIFRMHRDSITGSGRLREAYLCDEARIFEKVTGHPPLKHEKWNRILARIEKYALNPKQLMWSIFEKRIGAAHNY